MNKPLLQELVSFLVKETLLQESKQGIINLGFPEVIASILYKNFGNNAPLFAKWIKEYNLYKATNRKGEVDKDWWRVANRTFSSRGGLDIVDMVDLYEASKISVEALNKLRKQFELYVDPNDPITLEQHRKSYKDEIEQMLDSKELALRSVLVQDILSGKIKDLKPYKDLSFDDAKKRYDEKRVFAGAPPVKEYKNGWRWIDVGPRCELVGRKMKNCGSAGVMSMDPDRTIITLFDDNNEPHVVVTYSPNDKRISGDEGGGSSAVKTEYHKYVLDLAKTLGARFDYDRSKSKELRISGALGDSLKKIQTFFENTYNEYFLVTMTDGKKYYTNSYYFISVEDFESYLKSELEKANRKPVKIEKKHRVEFLPKSFNYQELAPGVISFIDFKNKYNKE